jgi:TRAP-type C4-dicarboxylate transport system substrate-binding protein
MRLRLSTILAAAAVSALPFATRAEPVQLKFASTAPPISLMNPRIFETWIKDVEAASDGTLKIQLFVGNSVATVFNVYDRTRNHVVDFGWAPFGPISDQFPKSNVVSLPFSAENHATASIAFQRTFENGIIADEHKAVRVLNLFVFPGSVIHSNKPIRNIAELKGTKIGIEGRMVGTAIERLGGVPISLGPPEMHQAAQRGVVEAVALGWVAVGSFKIDEVSKHHLNHVLNGVGAYIYMNNDAYAKLPQKAQAAIDKHSGIAFSHRISAVLEFMNSSQLERVKGMSNHTVSQLDAAELARWKEITKPIEQEWIKATPDGEKILSVYRAEYAKAEKK